MTWQRIIGFDSGGLIKDQPPSVLPDNVASDARNVLFYDGAARKANGYQEIYPSIPRAPYFLIGGTFNDDTDFLLYVSSSDGTAWYGGAVVGGAHKDISPVTITASVTQTVTMAGGLNNAWTGAVFNSQVVLNSGSETPLHWVSQTSRLAPMSNVSFTCASLRAYKNFLVAVDITKNGVRDPSMVKWSAAVSTGSNPSWDETDVTLEAGEVTLSDSPDACIDSLSMRDLHVVYKERSTWGMIDIGHPFIFRFYRISSIEGIMARNCAAAIKNNHVVLTKDDVIRNDGQSVISLVNKRLQRFLFNDMSGTVATRSFVSADTVNSTLWVCYSDGPEFPNKALVWDWTHNTWGVQDLPQVSHIVQSIDQLTGGTWDGDSGSWDSDSSPWDVSQGFVLTGASPSNIKIYQHNLSNTNDGTAMQTLLEKRGIRLGPDEFTKLVKRVRIWAASETGGILNVSVGSQSVPNEPPVYSADGMSTIRIPPGGTSTLDADVFSEGRFFALKIETNTDMDFAVHEVEFEVTVLGKY